MRNVEQMDPRMAFGLQNRMTDVKPPVKISRILEKEREGLAKMWILKAQKQQNIT